jgi:MoaE-MoaD fusion protein
MITVKLFALLRDKAGRSELSITCSSGTVEDLLKQVSHEYPALAEILTCGSIMVSVNKEFVKKGAVVRDGDEVALMPPFSGGSGAEPKVRIQYESFSIEQEIENLKATSTAIGAIVMFLGTTRDISMDKPVAKLEFEHYPGMAEKMLFEIRDRAIREYGVTDVAIIHRVGTIPVGDNIVLILVSSGHRDEAFQACRFVIDELKRITPIWKKETTPDGEVWIAEHP